MNRILLIAPPFYRLMGSHYNGLHLGIGYIAAVLKVHGHSVKLYNADYYGNDEYLNQRQLLENSLSYKTILNSPTHPIWAEIRDKITSFTPEFLGITMATANYKAAKNIAKIAKDIDRNIKVVVGGAHPTLDPEGTSAEEEFDYIVRGEGEFTFLELAEGKDEDEIKGLSFKKNYKIIHNKSRTFIKDLDTLPFASRDLFLNDTQYLDFGNVITGRGCPFSCSYCASPRLWQRTTRFRSVSNVVKELEDLRMHYNSPIVHFVDDTFTINKNRTKNICQQIIDRQLAIKWVCDTRANCLDKELVALMSKAGCIRVKIAAESGSDRILKSVRKGLTKRHILKAAELIKEQGLPLTVYFMVGFPNETDVDLRQTIKLAKELQADYYSLSVLAP
ncbi:B12-binding domain-containing radical SAM protein, partial [Chloroflexota bacterium]